MKKLSIIYILLFFLITSLKAQENYFYTSLKIPFLEYVSYALANKSVNHEKPTAGVILNAGYALNIIPDVYIETGIDYHLANQFIKKYYRDVKLSKLTGMLKTENSSFALQLRPTYKTSIDANEETFLSIGLGLNIQKLYSNGYYEIYGENNAITANYNNKAKSSIFPSLQPMIGISFKTNKSIAYHFGLTYSYINWNRAEKQLNFSDAVFSIPDHKMSDLFFSAGFTF